MEPAIHLVQRKREVTSKPSFGGGAAQRGTSFWESLQNGREVWGWRCAVLLKWASHLHQKKTNFQIPSLFFFFKERSPVGGWRTRANFLSRGVYLDSGGTMRSRRLLPPRMKNETGDEVVMKLSARRGRKERGAAPFPLIELRVVQKKGSEIRNSYAKIGVRHLMGMQGAR